MRRFPALFLLLVVGKGCSSPPTAIYHPGLTEERLSRVNFRPEGKVLRSANYLSLPNGIPAGSPARITLYSEDVIHLTINGFPYALYPCPPARIKFPTTAAGIDEFLKKYFVDERGDLNVDGLEPELKDSILAGRFLPGMTKEQVYTALGPPLAVDDGVPALKLSAPAILASNKWIYPKFLVLVDSTRTTLYFGNGKLEGQTP